MGESVLAAWMGMSMSKMRRIGLAVIAVLTAATLCGCLPDSGTVTSKRSTFLKRQWTFYVSVDGSEYPVTADEYLKCDVGEHVVKGKCP